MREFTIDVKSIPKACEVEGIEGFIKIKVPNMNERMGLLKASGYKEGDDTMDLAMKMMDSVDSYVVEVSIKVGDEKFDNFEDLSYYEFGTNIVSYVQTAVMSGIPLGKK